MVVVDCIHRAFLNYMGRTAIHPCHKLCHLVEDSQRSSSLDCFWVNHRMLNFAFWKTFFNKSHMVTELCGNLHFRKRVDSSTQYWKLSGLEASYQTKVLSRFTSGGIGRKPNPIHNIRY